MVWTIPNPYICAIILAMGAINVGFGMVYPSFTTQEVVEEFNLNETEKLFFNIGGLLCASFCSMFINPFVVAYGKRKAGFAAALYASCTWIILGLTEKKWMLFTFRCMSCSSIGLYTTFVSPFLAEIAPDNKKYFFGFINQIANAIGFLTVTIIGAWLNNFRKVAFICSVPNIVLCIGILFIPEKPQTTQRATVCATCKYHKELFIAFMFMFFLQFSGIQPVMSNLGEILSKANLGDKGHKMGIYATATQLVTTVIFAFIVDKVGNFIMWEISAAGEMIAFILMCVHQKKELPTWVFLLGLFLEMLSYGMGNGPIPFARATVLLEPQFRSTAMAIIVAINWALTAGINAIWPTLQEKMSLGYAFLFFACMMVLSLIFGYVVVRKLDLRDKASLDNSSQEEEKKDGKVDEISAEESL